MRGDGTSRTLNSSRICCLPAILRPHFAGVRVQNAVATAGRLGTTPARFTTMSCGLAVLLIRTHDALTANRKESKSLCGQASFMLNLENKLSFPQNNTRFAFYEGRRLSCIVNYSVYEAS